jgi:hypothetical protein
MALCSSNTLLLLESKDAIAETIGCVRAHLAPAGIFLIDVDAISPETRAALARYPLENVPDIVVAAGAGRSPLQRMHSIVPSDPASQSCENRFSVSYKYVDNAGGLQATRNEDVILLTPDELVRLVREQGFAIAEKCGWYDRRPFTGAEQKLIIFARKQE